MAEYVLQDEAVGDLFAIGRVDSPSATVLDESLDGSTSGSGTLPAVRRALRPCRPVLDGSGQLVRFLLASLPFSRPGSGLGSLTQQAASEWSSEPPEDCPGSLAE